MNLFLEDDNNIITKFLCFSVLLSFYFSKLFFAGGE